jgi:hypothetical protein
VPVLAPMALVAKTLIGYVLVISVLRWSCGLPGAPGRSPAGQSFSSRRR